MALADIAANLKTERAVAQAADLSSWQSAIDAAVVACAAVVQADVVAAGAEQQLPINLAWVSLNSCMPAGTYLEAWVDTEGVLDIEVPREHAEDLVAYVEAAGLRCGVEYDWHADRATLHVGIYRSPPAQEV